MLTLFSFWDPHNVNVGVFNVVPEVSLAVFFFFSCSFFYILFCGSESHHSVFETNYLFFCLLSAIDSFCCIVHVCLFFSYTWTLVNISCIFSILFPRSWIIFTIIILNSFSGRCLFPPFLVVFL